jgi:hypothetical protein
VAFDRVNGALCLDVKTSYGRKLVTA